MAVLAGMRIEERCTGHLACRTMPVKRKCKRCPTGLRTQFFLSHIMAPAATGFTDGAAHHQHVDEAAVVHVQVVPVVQAGTHNHHGTALGIVCVLCKFTCHTNHQFRFHTGVFFLPCRGVRFVFKIIFGNIFITQTVVHAVLCNQQIEYGRHQLRFAVGQRDFFHRHFAVNHFVVFAAIVAEADAHHIVRTLFQRTRREDFLALRFGFQIPFGAAVPTEAHRTVRHGQAVGIFIPNNGFPFGIFLFA